MTTWQADDGSLIYYERHGARPNRPALLLLPGLLGAANEQWQPFLEPLSADYQLLLVDLRGHGRSENRASRLLPEQMMADLLGLLEALELASVRVAGYDLGGYLGLLLHLEMPRRVSHLLMQATKFFWTKEMAADMARQLSPDELAQRAPGYANRLAVAHGASRWRSLVRQAADLNAYLAEEGLSTRLAGQAQCPVLVSVGDRDELVPVREAQRLSRTFDRGALLVLPGVGHPFHTVGLTPLLPAMQAFFLGTEGQRW